MFEYFMCWYSKARIRQQFACWGEVFPSRVFTHYSTIAVHLAVTLSPKVGVWRDCEQIHAEL